MSKPKAKGVSLPEIQIRRAVADEAEVVSRLIREAFGPFESEYTPGAFEFTTPDAATIYERFAEGPIWLAIDNGVLVGTVSGLPEPDRFYIRSMAVKPTAQGRGVGQQLLETLEVFAREAGHKKLYLYTTFVLPAAQRLYERNGFYVLRVTPPEEWYEMAGLEMEKELK
jgi:GNAT superfamily N-acetyltransferase